MVVAATDRKSQAYGLIMHLQAAELTRKKAKKLLLQGQKTITICRIVQCIRRRIHASVHVAYTNLVNNCLSVPPKLWYNNVLPTPLWTSISAA